MRRPDQQSPPAKPTEGEHELPPLEDPGKVDRAAHGVPVVAAFDGFRSFAILWIAVFHVLGASGVTAAAGTQWTGQLIWGTLPHFVDVLFILSGFVVFLPTVVRKGEFGSVGAYAIRRAARLLPAFWLTLLIIVLLLEFLPSFGGSVPGVDELLINVTGQHNVAYLFDSQYLPGFGVNLPLWTLTLEIGFYIVLPFVAASYFRRPLVGLVIAALIAVAWREVFANLSDINDALGLGLSDSRIVEMDLVSSNELPSWAFSFAAGMTGAWAYVRIRERFQAAEIQRLAVPIAGAALAVLAIFVYLAGRYAIDNPDPLIAIIARQNLFVGLGYTAALATLMLAIALGPRWLQAPFANRLARKLGDISYGVYLIHSVFIFVVIAEINPIRDGSFEAFALWTALVLPASILYGYLSARFLEQPIRRWARRFGRRAQSGGGQAQPATPSGSVAGGGR
jgi:peptidoglycan/LPS O-acetylase OafA/YrhL